MDAPLRIMPQSIEAEQSVIGAMIVDNVSIAEALEILKAEDFYKESHKVLYNAIMELFQANSGIDMLTLTEKLKDKDQLELSGGITYISEVCGSVISTANLEYYIQIVKEKSTLRKMIKSCGEIIENCYSKQNDVAKIIDEAEKKVFNISSNRETSDFEPLNEVLERGFVNLEKIYVNKGQIAGVPSGFKALDMLTTGFQKGDMVLIAARPSMGKTTFALNIAENAAIIHGKKVAVFSLEMSKEQLAYKLLCSQANLDMKKLRTGDLDDKDWENIANVSGPLAEAKIYIDDTAALSVMEMRSKCRRLKLQYGLDMIIIDYLQLMAGSRSENRQQEVSEISRSIKALAKEMQCPVIALSQLSRAPEARSDHRPMLSDLRESGSIEQDADIVMFLYRDEYYNKETEDKNVAECIISKQRNGPVGTVKFAWIGQYSKFGNLDVIHQE